jgi:hypothetical protein
MLDEGELDSFIADDDEKTIKKKERLAGLIGKLVDVLEADAPTLLGQERESDQGPSSKIVQVYDLLPDLLLFRGCQEVLGLPVA